MEKTRDELCGQIALLEEQMQDMAARNAQLLAERDRARADADEWRRQSNRDALKAQEWHEEAQSMTHHYENAQCALDMAREGA